MPYLTVYTNVDFTNGEKLAEEASRLTADILHKPIEYVVANFVYNKSMAFGGSSANKGALVDLVSIGLGDKDKFVAEMTAFLAIQLQIDEKRYIAMALTDSPAAHTAGNGRTFG